MAGVKPLKRTMRLVFLLSANNCRRAKGFSEPRQIPPTIAARVTTDAALLGVCRVRISGRAVPPVVRRRACVFVGIVVFGYDGSLAGGLVAVLVVKAIVAQPPMRFANAFPL